MIDLPKLTRITLGDGSFIHQHSTRFESNFGITDKVIDLPLLTDIVLVGYCLNGDSCMMRRINQIEPYLYLNSLTLTSMSKFYQSLKDLPSLTSIRNANGYSFNYYGLIRVVNVPRIVLSGFDLNPRTEYFKNVHSKEFRMAPGFDQYFVV